MDAWINNKGFPLVSLTLPEQDTQADHEVLTIAQSKFTSGFAASADSVTWRIPVRLTAVASDQSREDHFVLVTSAQQTMKLPKKPGGYSFFKLNAGHIGYYRSTYCERLTEKLLTFMSRYLRVPYFP